MFHTYDDAYKLRTINLHVYNVVMKLKGLVHHMGKGEQITSTKSSLLVVDGEISDLKKTLVAATCTHLPLLLLELLTTRRWRTC